MSIIKSMIPFSEEFIPPTLIDREYERCLINQYLKPLNKNEPMACNIFISGSVGVGKTVVTKFTLYSIPSTIPSLYINIKASDTFGGIVRQIAKGFIPNIKVGGKPTSELLNELSLTMRNKPALVVLDEIDKIPLKTLEPLLHIIPRNTWIGFILLSRKPAALNELSEDTKDSLKCRNIIFKSYKKEQLFEIVKQRVELALHPNAITDAAMEKIAEYASYFGNARLAIDILKMACEEAELVGDQVTVRHVESAIKLSERKSVIEAISDMPLTYKLALKVIMQHDDLTMKHAIKLWQEELVKNNLPKFSRWKFYDIIKDLKKLALVETRKVGRGRAAGFTTKVSLQELIKEEIEAIREVMRDVGDNKK